MFIANLFVVIAQHAAVQATIVSVVIVVLFARIMEVALDAGLVTRRCDEEFNTGFERREERNLRGIELTLHSADPS